MSIAPRTQYQRVHTLLSSCLCLLAVIFATVLPGNSLGAETFPLYPAIRNNVAFWEKIYSHYSINSAVIHDKDDLSKIYTVIDLIDKDLPGAERLNSAYTKATIKKYEDTLLKLSKGKAPSTHEEKHVSSLFQGKYRSREMKLAASSVRSQTGLKERFIEGVQHSGAHIDRLKWIFRSHGLPADLAYLPHVESSFNSRAYSKFGAAGMWQFTRATGKQYMNIDEAVDERLDPYISGESAARYLKNSYNALGNWPMALTAYNYGTSGMMRAKKAHGSYENIFRNYDQGHFGFASRNFYSEFLAATYVAKKLEKDPTIKKKPALEFREVRLPGYISMAHIIDHFKVRKDTIEELNPALKKAIFSGKRYVPKGYKLRLPDNDTVVKLARSIPKSAIRYDQRRDPVYRVKSGDTAGGIAIKHGISLKQLIAANSLDRNAAIYVGQRLRIPEKGSGSSTQSPVTYLPVTEKKQFHNGPPSTPGILPPATGSGNIPTLVASKKNLPDGAASIAAKQGSDRDTITVQPEESLSLYAFWLKIPEQKLRQVNKLGKLTQIHPGQRLTVLYSKVSAAEFAEQRAEFLHENEMDFFAAYKVIELKQYLVENGDTIWDLCNREFNIPFWLLQKYNRNLNYAALQKGQELTVPVVQAL